MRTQDELIKAGIETDRADLWTACPGVVTAYDASVPSANVQPQVTRAVTAEDGSTKFEKHTEIPNVPIFFFGVPGFRITVPIAVGTPGLLVVCTSDISTWLATGQVSDPGDLAVHHLAHAVFLPGFVPWSTATPSATTSDAMVLDASMILAGAAASDFVALSSKVNTELGKVAGALTTVANGGGALTGANTYTAPGSVAATKLKAE